MFQISHKKFLFSCLLFISFSSITLFAQEQLFRFKHTPGDQYRIISTVNEEVKSTIFVGGKVDVSTHNSTITNKVSVKINKVVDDVASITANFYLTENINHQKYLFNAISKNYVSHFKRNAYGFYSDDAQAFMPVVRNVPLFPERPIKVDESWTNPGYEVHDFSGAPFYINKPYKFPLNNDVTYTYLGQTEKYGPKLDIIKISYKFFFDDEYAYQTRELRPNRIFGHSDQTYLWDNELGRPYAYNESFYITLQDNQLTQIEYIGTAKAKVINSPELDKQSLIEEINRNLDSHTLNYSVKEKEEGVSISVNNILFEADTAKMLPNQEGKLAQIAQILKRHPERDILVVGHTALAGTKEEQDELSLARAIAVSREFLNQEVRTSDRIFVEGKGATEPVASNDTEEGKQLNRRVEIIILEN